MWSSLDSSLPLNVFTILRDLIHEQTGLYYDEDKRALLADKLSPRVKERGFGSFLDYYYLLKYGPDAAPEWPHVLNTLSVPETYFYREMGQINALASEVLPKYVAEHPGQPVKIWCAACATGEEPLTIAMILEETGWFNRASIQIHASDASPAAIDKARRGDYRERSFRCLPKALHDKYFTQIEGGWKIDAKLLRRVTFSQANLRHADEIDRLARVPFIFCRNVFIYFSDGAITQTINEFALRMVRPGYLFVGASESLLKLTTDFELQSAGEAFAYVLS